MANYTNKTGRHPSLKRFIILPWEPEAVSQSQNSTLMDSFTNTPRSMTQFQIFEIVFLISCLLVSTIGNSYVIWLSRQRLKQRNTVDLHILVLSLSLAELLQCVFQTLPYLSQVILGEWACGEFLCKVHAVARTMLANITISTLAIIAVIRFVNIKVFDRVRNLKGYIIALIVVWLLQCGVSVPNGIWNTVLATTKTCSIPFENLNRTKEYTLIVRVLCFFVPLVVMWLSNVGVVIKMRASSLKVQPFSAHINYAIQRRRRHRRVTLTCLFLALVFTINLTPFEASLIVIHVDSGLTKQLSLNVLEYLWLLTVLNTCVNPFIYGFCFKDLRQRLVRILESIMSRATNKSSTNNREPITDKTRRNLPRQDSIRIDVNQRSPSSDHTIRNQVHVHVITST